MPEKEEGAQRAAEGVAAIAERATQISASWMSCADMGRAYRDYMERRIDWATHRINQLARATAEMAPNGLRKWAEEICQAAWDATKEARNIVRSTL